MALGSAGLGIGVVVAAVMTLGAAGAGAHDRLATTTAALFLRAGSPARSVTSPEPSTHSPFLAAGSRSTLADALVDRLSFAGSGHAPATVMGRPCGYRLLYDESTASIDPTFYFIPLLGFGICIPLLILGLRAGRPDIAAAAFIFMALALGGTGFFAYSYFSDKWHDLSPAAGARTIEGDVEDFHPKLKSSHGGESFSVNGVRFSYVDGIYSGFHQTNANGGPIRSGLRVRITYVIPAYHGGSPQVGTPPPVYPPRIIRLETPNC